MDKKYLLQKKESLISLLTTHRLNVFDWYVDYCKREILNKLHINWDRDVEIYKSPMTLSEFVSPDNIVFVDRGEDWDKHYKACRYSLELKGVFKYLEKVYLDLQDNQVGRLQKQLAKQKKIIEVLWQGRKDKQWKSKLPE